MYPYLDFPEKVKKKDVQYIDVFEFSDPLIFGYLNGTRQIVVVPMDEFQEKFKDKPQKVKKVQKRYCI